MTKKGISLLLCICMIAMLLSGCGASDAVQDAAAAQAREDGQIKIGVSIWSAGDVLGSKCKEMIDFAADALGVTVEYVEQGHVSDQVTDSVEQLAADGCDGIIICNSADEEMPAVIRTCNDHQIYLAQFFRIISQENNPNIYKAALQSPYYVGAVHEDEPENGERLVGILTDKGYRNFGLIGWEQGDATWLGRYAGYQAGVAKWNAAHPEDPVRMSSPQYAGTTVKGGRLSAEALMTANPGLDALIPAGGGGDPLLGAIEAVENAGRTGEIGIVSTDFLDDLGTRLSDGSMAGESGGHYCDPLFAFLMVYQAIQSDGHSYETEFHEIRFPYLYVASPEDYEGYERYFVEQLPYTAEEIREMADMDLSALGEKAATLSIEDAEMRAGR